MKILMVHDAGRLTGGAEVQVAREIEALQARGHSVRSVVGSDGAEVTDFGDYFFRTPGGSLPRSAMLHNGFASHALRRASTDFQPDVVHFHTISKASPAVLQTTHRGVAVATLHDYAALYPLLCRVIPKSQICGVGDFPCCRRHVGNRYYFEEVRTALMRRGLRKLPAVIAPSAYVAQIAGSLGLSNMVLIPGSIPSAPAEILEKTDQVAYVGRLEPEKGVLELISEFISLSGKLPDVELVIAGTGSLDRAVRDATRRLGDRVRILGRVSPLEAQAVLSRSRVAVVPSLWPEPFGLVGPESMACGTPVVASGRGGISDWLEDGRNGLRADPSTSGAICAALFRLFSDRTLWQRCVDGSLRTAEAFSTVLHAERLENLYLRLLRQ